MARNQTSKGSPARRQAAIAKRTPSSLAIAREGVKTANDFARLMSALMGDLIEGSLSAQVGNATCKAGSNLLKVVELQHKYGSVGAPVDRKSLCLTD